MADIGEAGAVLSDAERQRLQSLEGATSLADLTDLTGEPDEHEAYVAAKEEWKRLRERDPDVVPDLDGLPGYRVWIDGRAFWVHGITHAGTDAERSVVREHAADYLDRGAGVYCEQGIRPMYLQDVEDACAMDDYRWAMRACMTESEGAPLPVIDDAFESGALDGLGDDVDDVRSKLREVAFAILESRGDAFGDGVKRRIGDLLATFLTSHEALGTAEDFTSHSLSSRAAEDPALLADLQRYYATVFLPQPIEREWLRRHDPNLERATHARNERMADYAVYHVDEVEEVHLLVGAAHQPGVRYYLERYRDGERDADGFEYC